MKTYLLPILLLAGHAMAEASSCTYEVTLSRQVTGMMNMNTEDTGSLEVGQTRTINEAAVTFVSMDEESNVAEIFIDNSDSACGYTGTHYPTIDETGSSSWDSADCGGVGVTDSYKVSVESDCTSDDPTPSSTPASSVEDPTPSSTSASFLETSSCTYEVTLSRQVTGMMNMNTEDTGSLAVGQTRTINEAAVTLVSMDEESNVAEIFIDNSDSACGYTGTHYPTIDETGSSSWDSANCGGAGVTDSYKVSVESDCTADDPAPLETPASSVEDPTPWSDASSVSPAGTPGGSLFLLSVFLYYMYLQ